jgi:hypothetical protein
MQRFHAQNCGLFQGNSIDNNLPPLLHLHCGGDSN